MLPAPYLLALSNNNKKNDTVDNTSSSFVLKGCLDAQVNSKIGKTQIYNFSIAIEDMPTCISSET